VLPEGVEAGLVGGLAVALVFLARDAWLGSPLHTPSVLGALLFAGLDAAHEMRSDGGMAAAYNAVHFAAWVAFGFVGSWLLTRAEEEDRWRPLAVGVLTGALLLALVVGGTVGATPLGRTHLWAGAAAGLLAMGVFLAWRHPGVLGARRAGG
jgi:hypothetical protein